MSFGGNNRRRHNKGGAKHSNAPTTVDESNPILVAFHGFARELDDKHDRYERIVKCGRDITIESKRIIFLLHTIDQKKDNAQKVLAEAQQRLEKVCTMNFAEIAKELKGLDQYQYARAFSPGLQEFIEALTFFEYISGKDLSDWTSVQESLKYKGEEESPPMECLVQPIEFMLGLADMTGEVMRRCVNSLGSGEVDNCFDSCRFLQSLHASFLGLGPTHNREMSRKMYTLRQSVMKSEAVCYNLRVRGKEAAKWGAEENLLDKGVDSASANAEIDEGFF
ncbi:translin-associated protein X [Phlebotomus papatasi]|uniref:translin-associated protein X n=1 Tax=Phlebotomus papatasi TaxID=29031 RepID=UPI0024836583|nr:translin-associated protein X [Phlebotomus papatasi]